MTGTEHAFSILNMRSSQLSSDTTARARIRTAAIDCYGAAGFDAPMRTIAAAAGVSAALIVHHFGSKQALRQECDEQVLREIREAKRAGILSGDPAGWVAEIASVQRYAGLAAYLLSSLRQGGPLAATFVSQLIADAEGYLAAGVSAGVLQASRDPAARARFLVYLALGALMVHAIGGGAPEDPADLIRSFQQAVALPALEIYTEGLLCDRSLLETYLAEYPPSSTGDGR